MTSFIFTLLSASWLSVALLAAGRIKPGYDHLRHTISELGEVGAPLARGIAIGVFLPAGLLLGAAAVFAPTPPQAALAACLAIGYAISALAPCDAGSPIVGSARQWVHNSAGLVQYLGGAASLVWLGQTQSRPCLVAGVYVALSIPALAFPHRLRGAVQRIAEACLLGGLGLSLWLRIS